MWLRGWFRSWCVRKSLRRLRMQLLVTTQRSRYASESRNGCRTQDSRRQVFHSEPVFESECAEACLRVLDIYFDYLFRPPKKTGSRERRQNVRGFGMPCEDLSGSSRSMGKTEKLSAQMQKPPRFAGAFAFRSAT